MRILAVDDDENIRELLSASVLAETRHQITTAPSAQKALNMVQLDQVPFDCFLLDIQMPGMDGVELCQRLRKLPAYRDTPILMLTAMAQKQFVDRAFQAGATDYISKPFEFLELFSRLKNAERLIAEQKRTHKRHTELAALRDDLNRTCDHSLCEPIEVLGIERMVGYVSFENYLLQLSRMRMLLTSVLAVKILNVEKVFRKMSRVAFRTLLTEIGQLTTNEFGAEGDLITYRGNGVFAIATSSRNPFSQFELEKALNRKIRDLPSARMSQAPVQVCAGAPVSLISLTRAGSLTSLQNAVNRAEARSESYHNILQMSERVRRNGGQTSAMPQQDRKAYEALLKKEMAEKAMAANS